MRTDFSIIPTDEELLLRLKNFEDQFVERKVMSDSKDWLKTAVAFANSAPTGFPCVLYLGVRNDGTLEPSAAVSNLEKVQATFAEKVRPAYPRIAYYPRIFRVGDQQVLAIIIPGSELKPHFTQRPHVRVGQQTLEATDAQFEQLIAQRNSKVAFLLAHKHEMFTVDFLKPEEMWKMAGKLQNTWPNCQLLECNQFFIVLKQDNIVSVPLDRVHISKDSKANKLRLEILA